MTVDLAQVMTEHPETAEPDLLRELLRTFVQVLMSVDADAAYSADYGTLGPERTNSRNGYRSRGWDTRVGSIDLALPKLRQSRLPHVLHRWSTVRKTPTCHPGRHHGYGQPARARS